MSTHPETGRDESESERIDRNLQEMIGELRVALPGVQVLFAFLLVVPFNQRFADVTSLQQTIYFITLLTTAAAATSGRIVVAEDHRPEGGLASAVTDSLLAPGRSKLAIAHLAVRDLPSSGSGAELLAWAGPGNLGDGAVHGDARGLTPAGQEPGKS